MARLMLLCMMLLLPVQWTWAAAAAYCAHEASGVTARHIGHHEHDHKASAGEVAKSAKPAQGADAGGQDLDCDYCHCSAALTLLAVHEVVLPSMGGAPPPHDLPELASHIGAGPERPDRLLAA